MKADNQTKVHFKGTKTDEDFIVFVDSEDVVEKWKSDKSIPLAQVIGLFKVFVTHKHGAQGQHDEASKGQLESEFDTTVDEDVIKKILEEGQVQHGSTAQRYGSTNDSKGTMAAH